MTVEFESDELEYLYNTPLSELKGKRKYPTEVIKGYKAKVSLLIDIGSLEDLRMFRGSRFEYLKGDRKGQCSLRINDQYRLIITPQEDGTVHVILINEISKHYE